MKALIYKDLISIKNALLLQFVVIIGLGIYFYKENQLVLIPLFFILIPIILLGMVFGIDNQYSTDKYLISSGISRKKIVFSRYTIIWFMSLFAIALSFVVGFNKNPLTKEIPLILILSSLFFITSIVGVVELPLMYKFGAEKARLVFVILYFLVFAFFSTISSNKEWLLEYVNKGLTMDKTLLSLIIFAITIIVHTISVFISIKIFENKEL
ncbi:MAG: ABC-2 transporter permease [Anaerococcus vaginalis]|uniref:ABC-2 transporter permease n=1 Tax=Anaerococcus vaginalis TaxID=33037 RepID=UPI0024320695|nr:ABC-2 transporter permease [Anaerococcus vaginalis]MBS6921430.1 ABC-2 transporter permease [Anaerococcus vaginalis]MDU4379175.1 ABC-2 transporter permease [Anaerococcus vaginalis]MDU5824911.1 ABC-2 transporter permease [Anaerococcus vaginalis]MDU6546887.1 ABC-2 transporter permease [Anaerococcus vaginalis]MDU7141969.1 ABC-2 transporter permease [Anaerococcus vaginalis]